MISTQLANFFKKMISFGNATSSHSGLIPLKTVYKKEGSHSGLIPLKTVYKKKKREIALGDRE